jgi:hypothetical protein
VADWINKALSRKNPSGGPTNSDAQILARCDELHAQGQEPTQRNIGMVCMHRRLYQLIRSWKERHGIKNRALHSEGTSHKGHHGARAEPSKPALIGIDPPRSHKSHAEQEAKRKPKPKRERTEWGRIQSVLKRIDEYSFSKGK